MKTLTFDVVIIGGGCAGMAAALSAVKENAQRVLILERASSLGGVLRQCIHNGFGLHRFKEDLTGVEYAARFIHMIAEQEITVLTDTIVLEIQKERRITAMNPTGLLKISAKSLVIATGCRERSRGALSIPGSRPAGIMSAGTAQRYMNLEGYLVGKRIVILGSGDIGLIMARQFLLEGAKVLAVVEIQPHSSGLVRNIVQCIKDFDIPLYYNTTVIRIEGSSRLTGVWLSQVDARRNPIPETERFLECDTLILSVGLIPENELSWQAGIPMDETTGGAFVDNALQTDAPGIFACGNALHVHGLVDDVTQEAELAGKNAALYAQRKQNVTSASFSVTSGKNMRGIVPQQVCATKNSAKMEETMHKTLICINCPLGCQITTTFDEQGNISVSGNRCRRGAEYAMQEVAFPMRILTGNMKVEGTKKPLSVKTDAPIPKSMLLECAAELKCHRPVPPIAIGDVIIHNILDTGANIIATQHFDIFC